LSTVFFCNSAFDEYCFYLYVYCMYFRFILFASALTRQLFVDIRQIERIVRPLVLGTLFRASSFRNRGVRSNERTRCMASR
jgi:hypothetical protein